MYDQIINKVKELGDALVAVAGQAKDIGVEKKWLTEWDTKIEQELTDLISTFPGQHIVYAEEISSSFTKSDELWVIDPISNTYNFIHGLPHYAIVLSHLHQGVTVFALVYDPSTKELFRAEKGHGAFLNDQAIRVSNRADEPAILVGGHLTPTGQYRAQTVKLLDQLSRLGTVRMFGSLGVHYAYVACGRVEAAVSNNKDVFPEFAGQLLVEEAGGKFTDFQGEELTISTHGVIASNGKIHPDILETIA